MAERTGKRRGPYAGAAIKRRLKAIGCDPFAIMAAIAGDEEADPRIRFYAARELAGYVLARPQSGNTTQHASFDVAGIIARVGAGQRTPAEWRDAAGSRRDGEGRDEAH